MSAMDCIDCKPCIQWLVRCRVLSADHRIASSNEVSSVDFIRLLKDGVLLCNLLCRLQPSVIDQKAISHKPQTSQYLCRKNIKIFLDTCRNQFGLKDADLFQTADLFEGKDIPKVLKTLSVLSYSPAAQKQNFMPFSCDANDSKGCTSSDKRQSNDSARASAEYVGDEEEVYQSLVDAVTSQVTIAKPSASTTAGAFAAIVATIPVDPKTTDAKSVRHQPRDSEINRNRERIVNELLTTEQKYVEALKQLIDHFLTPLKQQGVLGDSHKQIFFGIEELYRMHKSFCDELSSATAACSSGSKRSSLPECFINYKDQFVLYGEYCARLKSAQNLLDVLCKDDPVEVKVKECQNRAYEGRFKLRDMLAVPMQRILKYHLLLKELIRNTDDDHEDRDLLAVALDEMLNLSLFINEMTRDYEIMEQIAMIEKSIEGLTMPLDAHLQDYGRLLMDGEFNVRWDKKSSSKRYVFVFDKLMLLCKAKAPETYEYKNFIIIVDYEVESKIVRDKTLGHSFSMIKVSPATSAETKLTFGSSDAELAAKLMEAIVMAKDNVRPRDAQTATHDFSLVAFDKPQVCSVCHKLLRGVFFQGYRCKKTSMVVHKECISKVTPTMNAVRRDGGDKDKTKRLRLYRKSIYLRDAVPGSSVDVASSPVEANLAPATAPVTTSSDSSFHFSSSPKSSKPVSRNKTIVTHLPVSVPDNARMERRQTDPIGGQAKSRDDPPRACTVTAPSRSRPIYVNTNIDDMSRQPWFVGQMKREIAGNILSLLPDQSFLVRQSLTPGRFNQLSLSLKYGDTIKHLKVEENHNMFHITQLVKFKSVRELIQHYTVNTLETNFLLPMTLKLPYREAVETLKATKNALGLCVALYDYYPSEPSQLQIKVDDAIILLSKNHDYAGWWKGSLGGKTGYFPKAYVIEDDRLSQT